MDNAPIHTGHGMREFRITEPEFGRAVVFQPPYSPEPNPIEHVWSRMKLILRERDFSSPEDLRRGVREAWQQVARDRDYLRALTQSMPRRLNAVVEAEGGPTRYWVSELEWETEQGGVLFFSTAFEPRARQTFFLRARGAAALYDPSFETLCAAEHQVDIRGGFLVSAGQCSSPYLHLLQMKVRITRCRTSSMACSLPRLKHNRELLVSHIQSRL